MPRIQDHLQYVSRLEPAMRLQQVSLQRLSKVSRPAMWHRGRSRTLREPAVTRCTRWRIEVLSDGEQPVGPPSGARHETPTYSGDPPPPRSPGAPDDRPAAT